MIYISKFRLNDLNPSKGKQIEFNKTIIDNFFHFTNNDYYTEFECSSINNPTVKEKIKVHLKLSPARGDYKVYQNFDGSIDLKDFFLTKLHLTMDNINDYFAIKEKGTHKYVLYYIPKDTLFNIFFQAISNDQILFIQNQKEKNDDTNLKENLQIIFYGAPGTGKSYTINEATRNESVIRTTFHPDSDYSTFVGTYKPTTIQVTMRDVSGHKIIENENEVKEDRIIYEFVNQAFLQAYIQAWKFYAQTASDTEPQKQYLIIEEINRGNCAQIFGDLFQLLDRNDAGFSDYPIYTDNDMRKQLLKAFEGFSIPQAEKINNLYGRNVTEQVLKGEILLLPDNLYIWATMNTSDQSLFPVDSAFKRRWEWKYMPIGKGYDENGNELNWKICIGTSEYSWWSFLEKINIQISSTTNSEDKKLGFFFCKANNGCISAETFVGKVIFYLWNDVFKDYGFDGTIFKDTDGGTLSFNKFYKAGQNGKAIVQNDKVELFLKNLGIEKMNESDDILLDENGNTEDSKTKDFSRYSLNGNGSYSKGKVVYEAVKLYSQKNPEMTAQNIVDTWLSLSINVPNLIETDDVWNRRKALTKDNTFDSKSKALTLNNGEIIHISNQFNVSRIEEFINRVNAQSWNIRIEKL